MRTSFPRPRTDQFSSMIFSRQTVIPFLAVILGLMVVVWGLFFRLTSDEMALRQAVSRAGWNTQNEQTHGFSAAVQLPGMRPTLQFSLDREDASIMPYVVLYELTDRAVLNAEAGELIQIGSRAGYWLSVPGLNPSNAFIILGTAQAVSVSYTLRGFGNFMEFSAAAAPEELVHLIEALPVR